MRYEKEFKAESGQWTYLTPIEFTEFPEQPLIFDRFTIKKFTTEELRSLLKQRTCELFYSWAVVDTYKLSKFWMIVCTEEKPISLMGLVAWGDEIKPKYSPFSGKLKSAFRLLSLFKWREPYSTDENLLLYDAKYTVHSLSFYPSLPFTIEIPQGFLDNPPAVPDLSILSMEPTVDNFGDEVDEHPSLAFDISENGTEFCEFVKNTDDVIEKIRQVPQWQFMDVP